MTAAPADTTPTPQRGPSPRAALILLLSINLFNYVDRQVLAAVEDPIREAFHSTKAATGFLGTAFIVSYMVLSPVFGYLGDRWSRWKLIAIGVTLWSVASGASGLAGTFAALLITRCFVGVGEAAYGPVAPTILSDLYPQNVRGRILAWFYIAIPVGSALGYMLGGFANHMWSWRAGFYMVVPPGILLGVLALFMKEPARGGADAVSTAHRGGPKVDEILQLLRNRSYVLNTLGMTAMTFAIGGVAFWMPTYILERLTAQHGGPLPDPRAALNRINFNFGAITVAAGLLATPLGGILGDRLRPRMPGSYFFVSAIGLVLAFVGFLALIFCPFPAAWVLVFLAEFALFFNTGPSNTILANVTAPGIRASAFALNILIIHALGDAASPYLIGLVADHFSLSASFLLVSGLLLLGSIFWFLGVKHQARDEAAALTTPPVSHGFPVGPA